MFIKCEIGRKRKARERNLKCRIKGKVVKVKRMKDKFQSLMALVERDPAALKRNVLHMVLQHPEGIKFGDFSGAFMQLHGFHPQLALHGYHSLKDLVTEMKDFVVLEGDSQNPVIRIADGLDIYQWMEQAEGNEWDDSEEETQSFPDEETGEEEEAEVLELLTSLLSTYKEGLRIEKVQEFLLARNGVDLENFSVSQDYKDTLEFLEHRMPELTIKYQENRLKCVVQLTTGTAGVMQPPVSSLSCKTTRTRNSQTVLELLTSFLSSYKEGLKIEKVQEFLLARNGVDVEMFSVTQGYKDTLEFLEHRMPELTFKYQENRLKCVVQLTPGAAGVMQPPVSNSSCETTRTRNSYTVPELLTSLLSSYKDGLRIEKVQEFLLARNEVDLETFSVTQGYKDTLEFLEHRMPELTIKYQENRLKCVVQLTLSTARVMKPPVSSSSCKKEMLSGLPISSSCPQLGQQDLPLDSSKTTPNPEHSAKENRTQNGTEPLPNINWAVPQGLMPAKQRDPAVLKRNVLHLALQNPKGVKFGSFIGAFRELHGYHPKLALHGYRSLRHLLSDMQDVVVVEGDPHNPVIKVTNGSQLNHWLDNQGTGEENRLNDSEGKAQSLSCGEAARKNAEVLGLLTSLLSNYKKGLRIEKVQEFLLAKYEVNLEKFSIAQGYKDALEFVEQQIPKLTIQYRENRLKCVVMENTVEETQPSISSSSCEKVLQTVSTTSLNCISSPQNVVILGSSKTAQNPKLSMEENNTLNRTETPLGTNHAVPQVQEQVTKEEVDPGALKCSVLGPESDSQNPMPEIAIESPLCQWLEGVEENGWDDSEKSFHMEFPYGDARREDAGFSIAFVAVRTVLKCHPSGLKVKKLKKALKLKFGFDLERIRSDLGYKDIVSFLQAMPGLLIRKSSVVQNCVVQLESGPISPAPSLDTDFSDYYSNTTFQEPTRKESGSCISASNPVSTVASLGSKETSIKSETSDQMKVKKSPALEEVLVLLSSLLSKKGYEKGLRLKKVQELLLIKEGVDLEKFSIAQGHKNSLAFLERHMPELIINYQEDQLSCVLLLGSGPQANGPPPSLSASTLSLQTTKTFEPTNSLPVTHSSTASQFSASPGFILERSANQHKNKTDSILAKKPASCISTSTQGSACQSLNSKPSSIKSETSKQMKVEKKPALEEVLTSLCIILSSPQYKSGIRLTKVQEFLLTKERVDLEKYSIAKGHKDSLAFLKCHMPNLKIRNQEDRLNCVLQLKSGHGTESDSLSCDSSIPLKKTIRTVEPKQPLPGFRNVAEPLSNFSDSSANQSWTQNLSASSATIQSLPVSQEPHSAFSGKDKSSSQSQSDISALLSSEHQLHRQGEELQSNAQLHRRSNLTGSHHLKDQDELKQEVAHILARHPEGMSLFQFRAEYSAAYQKNLPLGNASSAKQCLLQMPDVVQMKGYGVQTLLFPVTSKESSLKSGQQIISSVEGAAVVPHHPLSKTVADSVVAFQLSPPKATVRPQPGTTHSLTSVHLTESGNTDDSVFSPSEMSGSSKLRDLLQEHRMTRTKLGDPSSQSHLFNAAEAPVAPGCSLSKTDPMVVSKSSASLATMAPVSQSQSFPHLYSECFKPVNNKESYQHPETLAQMSHKAATPVEEPAVTKTRLKGTPLLPSSPVVFPSDWGEMSDSLASNPIHPPKPSASGQSTLTPSFSQVLPPSFMTWSQPLVFPSSMFLSQHNPPPSLTRVHNISTPQPQNVKSHFAQTVPQVRPVQPMSPLQSTEQRNYAYPAQGPVVFSQEQMFSRTVIQTQNQAPVFSSDGLPIFSPYQNPSSACASRSQTVYQTEHYHHPWLDGTQGRPMWSTVSAMDNNIMTASSARAPPQSATYWSHSVCGNPLVTSSSTPPSHLPPSTNVSQQQCYISRHSVCGNSLVTSPSIPPTRLPPSPINVSQQQSYITRQTGTHSYALPSSDLGASSQPFEPQTLNINNKDPQAFKYTQQYADVHSTISSVATCPASSLTSPVYVPTNVSGQPSFTSHNSTTDHGASKQMKPLWKISKAEKQNNQHVTWNDEQKPCLTQRPTQSYSPAFQNSPPHKSPGKCVIL